MANINVKLTLLTAGGNSGPLYNAYYTIDNITYTIAVDGSNLSLPSVGSEVTITIPDNSTNVKLVNLTAGCQDNYYIVPVVTTTTTSTSTTTTSTTTCNPAPNWQNTGFSCYSTCNKYNVETDQNPCSPTYNTTRQGSLVESNSTYCGGCCGQSTTPNWQDTGIYNCYGTCNLYYEQQDTNSCSSTFGQTRQGPLYQTDSTSCGGCCGQSTSANWVSNGAAYCDTCVSKQPEIDNNPCSPTYNQTRVVNGGSACNTTQSWVNSGSYNCYSTCNKYNVEIQNNPCASGYNTTRQGSLVESNSTFCGGCCGQSTAATWVNTGSYSCYSTCNKYNVEQDTNVCSSTYGQTQQGSLVESNSTFCGGCCGVSPAANWVNNGATFCTGCTLYQPQIDNNVCSSTYGNTRNVNLGTNDSCGSWPTAYYCIGCAYYSHEVNSCTGNVRNTILISSDSTSCGGCCGQSTGPNWVDNGSTFCDGCNLQQPQIDSNPCSATYGDTRNVDLGVSSTCGTWNLEYYCVGYDKWSRQRNSCTNATCCDALVEVNSPYCGYVPPPTCRTYQIVGYNADEYVDGTYTNCGGGSDSFSFYGGPGTVGSVCAQISSVYITSGNGQANDIGGC